MRQDIQQPRLDDERRSHGRLRLKAGPQRTRRRRRSRDAAPGDVQRQAVGEPGRLAADAGYGVALGSDEPAPHGPSVMAGVAFGSSARRTVPVGW